MTKVRAASCAGAVAHVACLQADAQQDLVRLGERGRAAVGEDRERVVVGAAVALVEGVDPLLDADAGRIGPIAVVDVALGDRVARGVDVEREGRDLVLVGIDVRVDAGVLVGDAAVRRRLRAPATVRPSAGDARVRSDAWAAPLARRAGSAASRPPRWRATARDRSGVRIDATSQPDVPREASGSLGRVRMVVPQVPERSPRVRRRAAASTPRPGRLVPALRAGERASGDGGSPTAGAEDRPELAQDACRRAPHRQAVQLVRAVAQRPVADRALDHASPARRAGTRATGGSMIRATSKGDGDQASAAVPRGRRSVVTSKSLTGIHIRSSRPTTRTPAAIGSSADLLGRLAQRRRGGIGVLGLRLAAREADLAGVVAVAGRALDEHDPCLAVGRPGRAARARRPAGPARPGGGIRGGRSSDPPTRTGIITAAGSGSGSGSADNRSAASSKRMRSSAGRRPGLVDQLAVVALATRRREVERRGRAATSPPPTGGQLVVRASPGVAPAGLADDGRALGREHERARREVGIGRRPGRPAGTPRRRGHGPAGSRRAAGWSA